MRSHSRRKFDLIASAQRSVFTIDRKVTRIRARMQMNSASISRHANDRDVADRRRSCSSNHAVAIDIVRSSVPVDVKQEIAGFEDSRQSSCRRRSEAISCRPS